MKRIFYTIFFLHITTVAISQARDLDYYLEKGLQNSPLLKDIQNQARSNLIDSARIIAGYKPLVQGLSINSYAPVINGYGYEGAISNIGNFSELVSVSKQLVAKANLQNQIDAVRLANSSLNVTQKISEQDLKKAITAQYITTFGSWQQYLFNKEVYELLSKENTLLKKLTQASVYRQTDYLTFLVTLKQQQFSVSQAKIRVLDDLATLNYTSGLVDTSFTVLTDPALEVYSLPDIENSVYYRKFQVDSLVLKNEADRIDYSYKPKISVYADAGFVSTLQYLPYKNFGASFGISLSVPIYDGRQKKMQHDKLSIAEQTRKDYIGFFRLQFDQQIAQLLQQLQRTQELINEVRGQLKYSEALMDANVKLLATGDVRIADYILAINNYLNAKNVITQNSINKMHIINQLNYWNKQ